MDKACKQPLRHVAWVLNARWIHVEFHSQPMFSHVPTAFQQISSVANWTGYLPYDRFYSLTFLKMQISHSSKNFRRIFLSLEIAHFKVEHFWMWIIPTGSISLSNSHVQVFPVKSFWNNFISTQMKNFFKYKLKNKACKVCKV